MSRFICLGLLLVILSISTGVNGFFFGLLNQFGNQQQLAQQNCIIQANAVNCGVNSPIACGRVGASQQCVRFQNVCSLQASNCIPGARYTPVNANLCANVPLNTRGQCSNAIGNTGFAGNGLLGNGGFGNGGFGNGLVG